MRCATSAAGALGGAGNGRAGGGGGAGAACLVAVGRDGAATAGAALTFAGAGARAPDGDRLRFRRSSRADPESGRPRRCLMRPRTARCCDVGGRAASLADTHHHAPLCCWLPPLSWSTSSSSRRTAPHTTQCATLQLKRVGRWCGHASPPPSSPSAVHTVTSCVRSSMA